MVAGHCGGQRSFPGFKKLEEDSRRPTGIRLIIKGIRTRNLSTQSEGSHNSATDVVQANFSQFNFSNVIGKTRFAKSQVTLSQGVDVL